MVKKEPRVSIVHRALRRAILELALEPGAKLPEDAIGEQFGVSRTVVRRALERLAAEELVEIQPNRSALVVRPAFEQAQDLFQLRIELEDIVVRRLCGRLTQSQASRLEAAIDEEQAAFNEKRPDYSRLSAEFHIILASLTASPLLERYIRQMIWKSALVLRLYGHPAWESCNLDEHRELVAALVSGNTEHCQHLMSHHLEHLLNRAFEGPKLSGEPSLGDILVHYAAK